MVQKESKSSRRIDGGRNKESMEMWPVWFLPYSSEKFGNPQKKSSWSKNREQGNSSTNVYFLTWF